MRILVTWASWMLGSSVVNFFYDKYEIFATWTSNYDLLGVNYLKFNLLEDSYDKLIQWSNPDLIIHCAALTNWNTCESIPEDAFDVNWFSMKKILDATDSGVSIIYISTDAVFSENLHLAEEKDSIGPENIYWKSKELWEYFLLNSNRKYSIIRTTIVWLNININKISFVEWIINNSIWWWKLSLFDDVLFTPISIWDLIEEIFYLIKSNNINSEILHIWWGEVCSKYSFWILLLDKIWIWSKNIKKWSILDLENRVWRSNDQTLNCTFYQNKYWRKLPKLNDTIIVIKKYYEKKYKNMK